MTELTAYLSNIMGSVLLGMPDQMKEIIYLDALIHAASHILVSLIPSTTPRNANKSRPSPSTRP